MCLVCDIPPTLGRSREASLGWGGPEERAGDAALILPGRTKEGSLTRFPRPAGMPVPGDPGLHLEVTTDLPPGAWLTAAQK